jgi:hypothetical protein
MAAVVTNAVIGVADTSRLVAAGRGTTSPNKLSLRRPIRRRAVVMNRMISSPDKTSPAAARSTQGTCCPIRNVPEVPM